jgi:ABC-2 type transport system ATP-binding protein
MAAIRCEGLSRSYGAVEALKPLNLEVPSGTVFGFLGRNGAGKTTTIRLLTGLARPTSGRAWVRTRCASLRRAP